MKQVVAVFALVLSVACYGADWKAAVDGNLDEAAGWKPEAVPAATETLNITSDGMYALGLTDDFIAQQLEVKNNGTQYFDLGDKTLTLVSHFRLQGTAAGSSRVMLTGGTLVAANGRIGSTASDGNMMTVCGPGTLFTNSNEVSVGQSTAWNALVVTNGGQVYAKANLPIGYQVPAAGEVSVASNNWVYVADGGSLSIGGSIQIGQYGANNRMTVDVGGEVRTASELKLGSNAGADFNVLMVNGGYVTNSSTVGGVNVGGGGSGCGIIVSNNGEMVTYTLHVGATTSNNWVEITDGGRYACWTPGVAGVIIGRHPSAHGNRVRVSNGGTLFTKGGRIRLGLNGGQNNDLIVDNGSVVIENEQIALGEGAGATDNWLTIKGINSLVDANTVVFKNNSGVRFVLPNTPYEVAPIQLKAVWSSIFDATSKLEIDARALYKKGGGTRVPLMMYEAGNVSLAPLEENVIARPEGVEVWFENKTLYANIPAAPPPTAVFLK